MSFETTRYAVPSHQSIPFTFRRKEVHKKIFVTDNLPNKNTIATEKHFYDSTYFCNVSTNANSLILNAYFSLERDQSRNTLLVHLLPSDVVK